MFIFIKNKNLPSGQITLYARICSLVKLIDCLTYLRTIVLYKYGNFYLLILQMKKELCLLVCDRRNALNET